MIKTNVIKLKDEEYFQLPKTQDNIYFILGARGSGKSYYVKHDILKKLIEDEQFMFMYVRLQKTELATVISWLDEVDFSPLCSEAEYFKIVRGNPYSGAITLQGYIQNEKDKEEIIYTRFIGHCVSLETSAYIKSSNFQQTGLIVFEEFSRYNINLNQEFTSVVNFIELIETVARDRVIKVFCIGNNLKTIPQLEEAFYNMDNVVKYKVFKKRGEDSGVLAGVQTKFKKYLEGEVLEDGYLKVNDFIPIYTNKSWTIHMCKFGGNDILFTLNPVNKIVNIQNYRYHINDIVKKGSKNFWGFNNYKSEEYLRANLDSVIKELKQLLF